MDKYTATYPKPTYKRQKTKVQKIKLQSSKKCYVTGRADGHDLQLHHCIYGNGKRKLADKYGLTVWLVTAYHTGDRGVHNGNTALDMELKQLAQREFIQIYGYARWMQEFGRDYCVE